MTLIDDLFGFEDLEREVQAGMVVRRKHAELPLCILNYTDRCTYTPDSWNAVTRVCRGLIYNVYTHEIIARPFAKFFNWGQREAPTIDLSSRAIVTDKLDGSLGVLYPTERSFALSTRGSFDSEQAVHATELWQARYAHVQPPAGVTPLFEIVYPDNRIVVDYGGMDDLILLGAVEIATGRGLPPNALDFWPGPRATVFEHATLADALAAKPRPNAEGVVVHLVDHNERVKLKQADYVELHKIVTGLNERTVWEHLAAEKPLRELIEPIPDEFHEWVQRVAADLLTRIDREEKAIEQAYQGVLAELPAEHTRKDFALRACASEWKNGIFAQLDGKNYRPTLWRNAKPEARRTPTGTVRGEDAA